MTVISQEAIDRLGSCVDLGLDNWVLSYVRSHLESHLELARPRWCPEA